MLCAGSSDAGPGQELSEPGHQAEYLSSSQTSSEQEAILKRLQASKLGLQLLLTTPESFGTDRQYLISAHFSAVADRDMYLQVLVLQLAILR